MLKLVIIHLTNCVNGVKFQVWKTMNIGKYLPKEHIAQKCVMGVNLLIYAMEGVEKRLMLLMGLSMQMTLVLELREEIPQCEKFIKKSYPFVCNVENLIYLCSVFFKKKDHDKGNYPKW